MPATPGGPNTPSYKAPGSMLGGLGSDSGPGASPAPSIAPSPLATPRSQQPPSVPPQQEPAMPTLSPQPTSDKAPAATPDNNAAPKSVSSLSNQVFEKGKNNIIIIITICTIQILVLISSDDVCIHITLTFYISDCGVILYFHRCFPRWVTTIAVVMMVLNLKMQNNKQQQLAMPPTMLQIIMVGKQQTDNFKVQQHPISME